MNAWLNWILIVIGALLILLEVVLGAISGFDFLLIGSAVLLGGVIGLAAKHAVVGLAAAGVLSLLYIVLGRRKIRGRLHRPGIPSNTDALLGRTVTVVEALGPDQAGRVRLEGDVWRAVLDDQAATGRGSLAPGSRVRITRIDGVTAFVVPLSPDAESGKETS